MINSKFETGRDYVSPTIFFFVGLFYYFLMPPFAMLFLPDSVHVGRAIIWVFADQYDIYYFLDGIVIVASWISGRYLSRVLISPSASFLDPATYMVKGGWILVMFMLAVFVLNLSSAVLGGASFFSGYQDYDILVLGPFATLAFMAMLFRTFFSDSKVRLGFFLIFAGSTLILLGLGSRMLVVTAIAIAMIDYFYSRALKRASVVVFIIFAIAIAVGMLVVGVVRDGGNLDIQSLLGIFFAEPLYTSIGAVRYFTFTDGRPVFNFPYDVVAGFVNFIPSILFPEKVEVFQALGGLSWNYSPFGASALLVNLYKNFGMAYPLFIIVLALYYSFLQASARVSVFYRAIYFSSLPLLLLYIHREGFVTVIKVLLFNGLLLPLALISVLRFFAHAPTPPK